MSASMIGWSHTRFGRLDDETVERLVVRAARDAIADAGIEPEAIDACYLGHFNAGMVDDAFASSLVLQADPALRFMPATRVENACASGAAALYQARRHIAAGEADVVLVVGVEKMTALEGPDVTRALARAAHVDEQREGLTFPGIFARFAQAYFDRFGDASDELAMIAAKNHANGVHNPYAHMRRDLGFAFCRTVSERNPIIAAPLRKTDCSLVSDGAAAVVLASERVAATAAKAVGFRAAVQVSDFLPLARRDTTRLEGATQAWDRAYAQAGISVDDLDFAEVHDCFTIAELLIYEAMGLAPYGEGARVVREGRTRVDGDLPVNASGGLKAKGHPVGATGVSMHVVSAMQLVGEAGAMQLPAPALAGVFNMGGSGVANYVSILERVR